MASQEEQLKRISEKLQLLLKRYTTLQKENARLRDELAGTREESVSHQKSVDTLRRQVAVHKLSTGSMNDVEKKEVEKRINSYLKEIDRCIALLGE